jgi:hypothetical protein
MKSDTVEPRVILKDNKDSDSLKSPKFKIKSKDYAYNPKNNSNININKSKYSKIPSTIDNNVIQTVEKFLTKTEIGNDCSNLKIIEKLNKLRLEKSLKISQSKIELKSLNDTIDVLYDVL